VYYSTNTMACQVKNDELIIVLDWERTRIGPTNSGYGSQEKANQIVYYSILGMYLDRCFDEGYRISLVKTQNKHQFTVVGKSVCKFCNLIYKWYLKRN
jgi:hypothetical protein